MSSFVKYTEDGLENNSRNALIKLLNLINFGDDEYSRSLRESWVFKNAEKVVQNEKGEVIYHPRNDNS